MSLINSLPEDIIIDCIARVPRRYYPTLSLVSKYFRSLIKSHELYARRVLLDRTEYCLYVIISESGSTDGDDRLYTLRQNFNSPDKKYSLVPVTSLPMIPPRSSYVTMDSKIFVIPNKSLSSTDTLLIDCRFHTAQNLPSMMPNEVGSSVFKDNSIGEMIIDTFMNIPDRVVTFLKQIPQTMVSMYEWSYKSDRKLDLATLKIDILNLKACYDNECFLHRVPNFDDPRFRELEAVDVRKFSVEDVKSIKLITHEDAMESRTVVYGEKVVVFLQMEVGYEDEIWCVEIKVERDQKGELCGRVEWCGCVLEGRWPALNNCLVVKV